MKFGQYCCCEYSLSEICNFSEFATVCGCYIFRVICKNLCFEVLFSVYFFSERNTQYYFIVLNCYNFCALQASVPSILVVQMQHINLGKKFYRGLNWRYCANKEQTYTENMKSNGNNGSKYVTLDFVLVSAISEISVVSYCS